MKQAFSTLTIVIQAAFCGALVCGLAHAQEPATLEMISLSEQGLMPSEAKKDSKPTPTSKGVQASTQKLEAVHANFAAPMAKPHAASTPVKSNAGVVGTYQVKAGDTLDRVVQRVWPDSPLKPEVLKQAIVEMNPNAMTRGMPKMLMAGATLNLPNERQIIEARMNKKDLALEHAEKDLKTYTSYPDQALDLESAEKRRHWVAYP